MRNLTKMLLAGAVAALMLPIAAQAEIREQTLRFASAGSEGSPLVEGQRKFAEIVKEKSGGKIEVKVFPAGQLGGDMQAVSSLQGGVLQMSVMNAGLMASLAPDTEEATLFHIFIALVCLLFVFAIAMFVVLIRLARKAKKYGRD